jgi:hypothetical protein
VPVNRRAVNEGSPPLSSSTAQDAFVSHSSSPVTNSSSAPASAPPSPSASAPASPLATLFGGRRRNARAPIAGAMARLGRLIHPEQPAAPPPRMNVGFGLARLADSPRPHRPGRPDVGGAGSSQRPEGLLAAAGHTPPNLDLSAPRHEPGFSPSHANPAATRAAAFGDTLPPAPLLHRLGARTAELERYISESAVDEVVDVEAWAQLEELPSGLSETLFPAVSLPRSVSNQLESHEHTPEFDSNLVSLIERNLGVLASSYAARRAQMETTRSELMQDALELINRQIGSQDKGGEICRNIASVATVLMNFESPFPLDPSHPVGDDVTHADGVHLANSLLDVAGYQQRIVAEQEPQKPAE